MLYQQSSTGGVAKFLIIKLIQNFENSSIRFFTRHPNIFFHLISHGCTHLSRITLLTIIMNWCGITLCCQFRIPYFNFSSFLIAYGSHKTPNKFLSFICNLLSFMFVTYRARCPITASSLFLVEGCWGVTSCCIKSNADREHGISGISSSLSPNIMQCPV